MLLPFSLVKVPLIPATDLPQVDCLAMYIDLFVDALY